MNVPAMLVLTIGAYLLGVWVKDRSGLSLLHPFIISLPIIIAVLDFMDIPYEFYMDSNALIDFLLGPSVVALGYLLYDKRRIIIENIVGIASAVLSGSIVGVASVYVLCRIFRLDEVFFLSMEAKSVTTPIAMDITSTLGGNLSLAAVSVIISGFLGAVFGPAVLKLLRIKSPVAKGLALGCASHGLGTARALEYGYIEGAISGLSIALMGIVTAVFVPIFNFFFL